MNSSRCRRPTIACSVIIPLSLALILMLLYSMFSSVKDCLLVMVNVLEAAMGGVFALYFTGTHFSISGAVGFVSVFGVAVQDGVLLVTYCNQMRARGYSRLGDLPSRPRASRCARS